MKGTPLNLSMNLRNSTMSPISAKVKAQQKIQHPNGCTQISSISIIRVLLFINRQARTIMRTPEERRVLSTGSCLTHLLFRWSLIAASKALSFIIGFCRIVWKTKKNNSQKARRTTHTPEMNRWGNPIAFSTKFPRSIVIRPNRNKWIIVESLSDFQQVLI